MGDQAGCRATAAGRRPLLPADRGDAGGGGELGEAHPQSGHGGESSTEARRWGALGLFLSSVTVGGMLDVSRALKKVFYS